MGLPGGHAAGLQPGAGGPPGGAFRGGRAHLFGTRPHLHRTHGALRLKDLITNVLSLVIVLELVRVFVEYFEFERVRLEALLEVGIALALRELLLLLFAEKFSGMDLFLWSLGILALVAGRTLAVRFPPERRRPCG